MKVRVYQARGGYAGGLLFLKGDISETYHRHLNFKYLGEHEIPKSLLEKFQKGYGGKGPKNTTQFWDVSYHE